MGGIGKPDKRLLIALTEEQRAETLTRFQLIRPFLEGGVSLANLVSEHQPSERTLRHWVRQYRTTGLAGLVRAPRKDQGQQLSVPVQLQQAIEGLALQKPRRTTATIQREAARIGREHGWTAPSYSTVKRILDQIDPAMLTLAHEGAKTYREAYDLIYRHQAHAPNEVWQADYSLLPIFVLNEQGKPAKPWLTIILDDYSRAVAGYYLGFTAPTAQQTALTLHQAIWRKTDPRWHTYGVPARFYTDNGSDFTSHHLKQVAADLKMELVFSWPGQPRGRGKIERFFRTVEQRLLPQLPGFEGTNGRTTGRCLTLSALDSRFREWLLEEYQQRAQARWESGGFLPRLPDSLEQLDLLLLYVAKQRRIQQDGIHFQGQRYFNVNLAAYVDEDVTIRYDSRDLAIIRVFYRDRFLCQVVCAELAGTEVSLKEIIQRPFRFEVHHRSATTKQIWEQTTDTYSRQKEIAWQPSEKKDTASAPSPRSPTAP